MLYFSNLRLNFFLWLVIVKWFFGDIQIYFAQLYSFSPSLSSEMLLNIMCFFFFKNIGEKFWWVSVYNVWPIISKKNPCKMFSSILQKWFFLYWRQPKQSPTYLSCLATANLSDEKQYFSWSEIHGLHASVAWNFVVLEMSFF